MRLLNARLALVLALGTPLQACERPGHRRVDVERLATDLHFVLGERRVVLPAVAVLQVHRGPSNSDSNFRPHQEDKDLVRLHRTAKDQLRPLRVTGLEIWIAQYGYYGEVGVSQGICPRLRRAWSRRLCTGEGPDLTPKRVLPETFHLVERSQLGTVARATTAGRESQLEQIARMKLAGLPEAVCDRNSRFCTAAVALPGRVVAVWTVEPKANETAQQVAQRQGSAIAAFVQYSIGERELQAPHET